VNTTHLFDNQVERTILTEH